MDSATDENTWRAAIFDSVEGIVVIDVTASSYADAKGVAHTAAESKLGCKNIKCVTVTNLNTSTPSFINRIKYADRIDR